MTDHGLLNLQWSQALADGFAAAGVRELVLSPGSRSTPLALAFLRQPLIRCHVILDERSAGFFALGRAKASGHPVALLCTSGSAPANWFPAVIEADQGALPLILLSADRPPELQGCGANQTIDQNRLFGCHVRAFHDPGAPHADLAPDYLNRLAARAVSESRWPLPGPVHLNLPFREPLLPASAQSCWPPAKKLSAIQVTPPQLHPDAAQIAAIAAVISGRPGIIVCGAADYPPAFAVTLSKLASQLSCPVFAEPLSNLRFGRMTPDALCVRYDTFLRQPDFVEAHRPQWVLRFGAFPVTRTLQSWLSESKGKDKDGCAARSIVVTPDSRWPDPQHGVDTLLIADPAASCNALLANAPAPAPETWHRAFAGAEQAAERLSLEFMHEESFEGALVAALLERLPAGHRFFCGNSMAIRDLDAFSGTGSKRLTFFGNRGASGIDGNIATAAGIAASGSTVALLGDLTCAHDIGALACVRDLDLVLVVINNAGGGIFDYLPQAALPAAEFERAWLTPQNIDFSAAARCFSLHYARSETLANFTTTLEHALAKGGATLIEVVIDRSVSVARHRAYWDAASILPS
jgi:2-succinyl-5-enolpyruvyl-6-hydroxy-3-cyclohexene-1-carboxylate synthase